MKKNRTFSFYSSSCPDDVRVRIREVAAQANMKMMQTEHGFDLHIDSHHGGQVFYKARISAGEHGGTVIAGEIITVPWGRGKNKTKFQKAMEVLGYTLGAIVLSPLILLVFLCLGLYELFLLLKNRGKAGATLPREEEKLLNFMLNRMCCKQL